MMYVRYEVEFYARARLDFFILIQVKTPFSFNSYSKIQIWIRRAGPNYQDGLSKMRETQQRTGLPIHIYGPETHVTAVVPLALGLAKLEDFPEFDDESHQKEKSKLFSAKSSSALDIMEGDEASLDTRKSFLSQMAAREADHTIENFTAATRCVVYGLQHRAVQGMLDFDFMCKRDKPSVAAMIFPFSSNHYVKYYWGTDEILLPGKFRREIFYFLT